jgi:hypothetical protein
VACGTCGLQSQLTFGGASEDGALTASKVRLVGGTGEGESTGGAAGEAAGEAVAMRARIRACRASTGSRSSGDIRIFFHCLLPSGR